MSASRVVLCLGDSNTYGYDPRGCLGGRYGPKERWVDILAERTNWTVRNRGQNGLEIPAALPPVPADTDLMIVMLGTNDLLQGRRPEEAAERLEALLSPPVRCGLLLIAPPPLSLGAWVPRQQLVEDSRRYARLCQSLAARMSIPFANAADWNIPLSHDGVHFTPQGHKRFAEGVLEVLL